MTITNYTDLKSAVEDWTHRADMTSRVPQFVAMAESQMNMRLRLRHMEATSSLTLSATSSTVTLPAGFLEPISLVYATGDGPKQLSRDVLDDMLDTASSSGRPNFYAYGATTIDFDRTADVNYALTLRYFKKLDLANDASNSVLTAAPFAYLYGTLTAFSRWSGDNEGVAGYGALFEQQLMALEQDDSRSRGSAELRTELPAIVGGYIYDITRG